MWGWGRVTGISGRMTEHIISLSSGPVMALAAVGNTDLSPHSQECAFHSERGYFECCGVDLATKEGISGRWYWFIPPRMTSTTALCRLGCCDLEFVVVSPWFADNPCHFFGRCCITGKFPNTLVYFLFHYRKVQ